MKLDNHKSTLLFIASYSILTIVIWQLPYGRLVLYPFTILGTWFHEISHGLFSIFFGGNFIRLEIFQDGSGLAVHTGDLLLGGIGDAVVAGAGPMGPTIFGTILLRASFYDKYSKISLIILALFLILSSFIWIRSLVGFIVILSFGIVLLFIGLKSSLSLIKNVIIFLGIQAFLSVYLSIGYLFSQSGTIEGKTYLSDTGVIQNNLLFPYWFWAGLIILVSLTLFILSLKKVYK